MAGLLRYADVAEGDALPTGEFPITRLDLVRYAGASGDFNDIHWNERVAREVGLPDVIAHGNLTLEHNCVRVDLTASSQGVRVLGQARAVVRLA
jgi:acyl dehydratase